MSETEGNQGKRDEAGQTSENIPPEGIAPSGKSTMKILRDSPLVNAKKTLDFINNSEKDETVKIRVEDRPSTVLLTVGLMLFALVMVFLAIPSLRSFCGQLAIVADITVGLAALWFVVIRVGILRVMNARYALVCYQLLLGTGVLFALVAVNITLALVPLLEYLNQYYLK